MTILVSLLFAAVIALVFLLLHRRYEVYSTTRHYHCAPPRKHWPKDIFFGLDFTFEMHSNLAMMKRNHDRFGLTYQSETLFGDPVLNTIAPENLPLIHSSGKNYGVQPVRLPGMEYFCGQGFLTTDGPVWLQARKMLKPSFAKQNISQLDFLGQQTRKLMSKIPADGTTIDLQHPLFVIVRRITYDFLIVSVAKKCQFLHSSLHFLLGIDPSERDQAPYTAEEFIESFHAAIFGTGLCIMLGRFRGLAPKVAYAEACRRAHDYIEYYIKRALENSTQEQESPSTHEPLRQQRSMVKELATQTNDMNFIRSQIVQGMLAAQETISVLVSNTLFLLARHPDEWAQLRTEVLDYGEALFEFHNLSSFKPLQHILNEALRLHPVFPMLGRTCLQDTTLPVGGGKNQDQPIYISKGTFVVTSYIAMHTDEKVFGKSPESFRPSRWNDIRPSQWEYMPFGGGERACLGKEKVLAEAAYVVGRLAQRFARVERRDDEPWTEVVRMTAKNVHGCKVGLFGE